MLPAQTWIDKNQKYLVTCTNEIKTLLKNHVEKVTGVEPEVLKPESLPEWSEKIPPAIETVCEIFGLTYFERSLLLLCAGFELDSEIPLLCARAQGNKNMTYPTFGLALAALPEAHWSALTSDRPLRGFRLIRLAGLSTTPRAQLLFYGKV